MKLIVNKSLCVGCGACVAICGECFDFDENSLSKVIKQPEENNDSIKEAIDNCPTQAITVEE